MTYFELYLAAIALAAALSWALTPAARWAARAWDVLDQPGQVKTHKTPTPSLGGAAIWTSFTLTLLAMRFWTQFETGTLRNLRAILIGGTMVFLLGLIDDLKKPHGLHFKPKFCAQLAAAAVLLFFGIRIRFITPDYVAAAVTLLWVVGITNALNLIDIMDGLAASQVAVASLAFLAIALPSEHVYVNFAAAALLGSALGFLPHNLSAKGKIFMGDSGSLPLGFVLSALALGTGYSQINPLGVFAPLFILLVPMYDTFFVMVVRVLKGRSPFLGSKDHFALRLETMGLTRHQIVALAASASALLAGAAFLVTRVNLAWSLWIYGVVTAEVGILSWRLYKIEVR